MRCVDAPILDRASYLERGMRNIASKHLLRITIFAAINVLLPD